MIHEDILISQLNKEAQCKKLLKYLRTGKSISSLQATLMFGITSLHRRLTDLENKGHEFTKEWVKNGQASFYRYKLK